MDIDPLDVYTLVEKREHRRISIYRTIGSLEKLSSYELADAEKLYALFQNLRKWKTRSDNEHFLYFFEDVVRESGFLQYILSLPGYATVMDKLHTLFDEARKAAGNRRDYKLADFLSYLSILEEHGVMIRANSAAIPEAVRLMTAHRAKGLEFDLVYIIGVYDGHWGNKRAPGGFSLLFPTSVDVNDLEKNEDERRLFYMAITRARHEVFVSYATHSPDGREQVPSQFIGEVKPELKKELTLEQDVAKEDAFAPRAVSAPRVQDREFLKELFLERGFAATHLNNYLECPWLYFYNNLVRIPHVQDKHQLFGTAVHRALELTFGAKKEGKAVDAEFAVAEFSRELERVSPMSERDFNEVLKKGRESLCRYWERYKDEWNYNVLTEFAVRGVALNETVRLTGKLDKLELQPNSDDVIVVDYKTAKPKSRNWIEGNTADSNGDYKRQLVFYKLLLDLYPERSYRMIAGQIDFVEPNERGIFKKEAFEIVDVEVEALKTEILRVTDEILTLAFWDKKCGEKDCEYCALRAMMA